MYSLFCMHKECPKCTILNLHYSTIYFLCRPNVYVLFFSSHLVDVECTNGRTLFLLFVVQILLTARVHKQREKLRGKMGCLNAGVALNLRNCSPVVVAYIFYFFLNKLLYQCKRLALVLSVYILNSLF